MESVGKSHGSFNGSAIAAVVELRQHEQHEKCLTNRPNLVYSTDEATDVRSEQPIQEEQETTN